jgi:hypothetical protein
MGIPCKAAITLAAMNRNVDQATLLVKHVAGAIDHAKNFVAGDPAGAPVPELDIAPTQCGALNTKQDFAGGHCWLWPIFNRDLSFSRKARTTHHR